MSTGNMGDLLRNAQKMRKQIDVVQRELKDRVVEGKAADGAVVALINGQQELLRLTISPEVVSSDPDDVELLEDMIVAAIAQGMDKARELKSSEISKVTGGMGDSLAGLFG